MLKNTIVAMIMLCDLNLQAQKGFLEIVKLFVIELSAPILYIKDRDGNTPLHIAVKNGHEEIVNYLLENNADSKALNDEGSAPIHYAAISDSTNMLEIFLKNDANRNLQDKKGNTPLHLAAKYGKLTNIELLLENEADPNIFNKEGYSALHYISQ